jgi:hypothetical protein
MSAISSTARIAEPQVPETGATSVYDVTDCIKSWGRRGILWGAVLGFALGAIFVAIPLTTDILTFGAVGTLIVAAVECAVIAGGFAALAAALFGKGARNRTAAQFEHILLAGRRSSVAFPHSTPLSELPAAWTSPAQAFERPFLQSPDEGWDGASSLPAIQARLDTIDAWENGNTGP